MGRLTFGCSKVEMGDFNATTGASSNWTEVPVYRNTITVTEPEPAATEHYQQGRKAARLRKVTPASIEVAFQVMETDPDTLVIHMGGTVTTVEGVKTWNAPKTRGEVTKSLRYTLEDGTLVTIPAFSHYARLNYAITEDNINLIDVDGIIADTGIEEVSDMTITDPDEGD